MNAHAVDPVAAVDAARRQHDALYVDTIELADVGAVAAGRYAPRKPNLEPIGEYRALVQIDRNMTSPATPGPSDKLLNHIVVKTPLDTPIRRGMVVVVTRCDHTPSMVGRRFRVVADDTQSLAVTLRFRAVESNDANIRPPDPDASDAGGVA